MKKVLANVYALDVWGNCDEGYEVNDSYIIKHEITFDIDDNESILQALIDAGILIQDCTLKDIFIDGDDMLINVEEADGFPIVRLEIIDTIEKE